MFQDVSRTVELKHFDTVCFFQPFRPGGAQDEKAVLSSVLHAGVARGELYEALPNWTTGGLVKA